MGSQFRSCYLFNVIFRKEFFEAVTKFVPSIHSVCPPENENIVEPEDISKARKINQMLRIL